MITYEKVRAYWHSMVNIYNLIQEFSTQGYRNIVIPSRGVCPIYLGAQQYHQQKRTYECGLFNRFEERMEWNASALKESYSGQIWLPFTAQTGHREEDENTYQIRLNWCKVLKSIIYNKNSINSIAYHVLTETIGKSYGHTRSRILRETPILLIDTVVSGRAATEIAQAFDEIGLTDYKMILAVDARGDKLNKQYKSQLLGKYSNQIELVYFDDLFTEDQGPIYTNIFGVIYPNLTRHLREEFSDPSIAVGSLHMKNGRDVLCKADRINLNKYKKIYHKNNYFYIDETQFKCNECLELGYAYNTTRSLFSLALFSIGADELYSTNSSDRILYVIDQFNENFEKHNYSDTAITLDLFERTTPLNMETSNDISSSHVIRCDLQAKDIEILLDKIRNKKIKYENQYRENL